MGRRLIVLLGLGAAAVLLRRRSTEPTAAPAPPAPAPPAPAPAPTATPVAAAVAAATNGHAGSTNGHAVEADEVDDDAPYGPGSAAPTDDGSAPEGFAIKAKTSSGLYHTTASPSFKRTRADVWFCTPEDAERAGFTAWNANRKR
jgi:hypothetical protein